MSVEYGRIVEVEDNTQDNGISMVKRVLQNKETIQKFQGISVEELLYTTDEFITKTKDIKMKIEQKWEEWLKVQSHGPRKIWDKMMNENIYSCTELGLQEAIQDYIKNWAKDPRVRNTMIKNFQKKFRKPIDAEVHEHHMSVDLLMDYIDLLSSTTNKFHLADEEQKDFFFETFPYTCFSFS